MSQKTQPGESQFFTVEEFAAALKISTRTVWNRISDGTIPVVRLRGEESSRGVVRISSEVFELLQVKNSKNREAA